jgi:hypothetical protein
MTEESVGMSMEATVAQARIAILAAVLKMVREFLQSALAALPLSAQELNPQGDLAAKPAVTSEVRRIGDSVLVDFLDPAIRELSTAALYGTGEPPSS